MAHFLFADDSIVFDGQSMERGPLGGAESAFVSLCHALAARGHKVSVRNKCLAPLDYKGVNWRPMGTGWADNVDVYVANRSPYMLPLMPHVRRRVFWIHNPAQYLLKWRYFWRLAYHRPTIVFSGNHHAATYPAWAPPWLKSGTRAVIPYGIVDELLHNEVRIPPQKQKVIFTSNPMRSLDWLLHLWGDKIFPAVPKAELHIFSGASTYKAQGTELGEKMDHVLSLARSMKDRGVVLREPVAKSELRRELMTSRAMLYRGDVGETFCMALGEAQAIGVPAVVQPIGCVAERVVDGQTGYVTHNDDDFANRAIDILTKDDLWQQLHQQSIQLQQSWNWDMAAAMFEKLAAN